MPGKKSSLLGCGQGWADLRGNKARLAHSKILLFIPTPLHFLKEEIRKSIKAWGARCNPAWSCTYSHPLSATDQGSAAAALPARCAAGASTPPHIPKVSSTFPVWLHGFITGLASPQDFPKFPHGSQGRFLGLSWLWVLPFISWLVPAWVQSHITSAGFKMTSLWNTLQKTPNILFPSQNYAAFRGVLLGVFLRGANWKFHLHPEFLRKSINLEKLERPWRKRHQVHILVPFNFTPQILEFCPLSPTDKTSGFRENFMSHMALIASPLEGCHLLFGGAGWIICHISNSVSQCPPIKSVVWQKK